MPRHRGCSAGAKTSCAESRCTTSSTIQHADGTPIPEATARSCRCAPRAAVRIADEAFTRKDGSIFPVAYSAAPLLDGWNGKGVVVVFRDTTEEQAEQHASPARARTLAWVGRIRDAIDEDGSSSTRSRSFRSPAASRRRSCYCGWSGRRRGHPARQLPAGGREVRADRRDRPLGDDPGRRLAARAARRGQPLRRLDRRPRTCCPSSSRAPRPRRRPGEPRLRDHRDRAHARHRRRRGLRRAASPTLGCGSPSTTSAPASAASPTSSSCPSLPEDRHRVRPRPVSSTPPTSTSSRRSSAWRADFGYQTIAEGVEDEQTLELLRELRRRLRPGLPHRPPGAGRRHQAGTGEPSAA